MIQVKAADLLPGLMGSGFSLEEVSLPYRTRRLDFKMGGALSASIFLYEPNFFPVYGSKFPLDLVWLAGSGGRRLMEQLSEARLAVDEDSPLMKKPQFREWRESPGAGGIPGVCSKTTSFRRHVLDRECVVRGKPRLVQIKIAGEEKNSTHRVLSGADFDFGVEVLERCGEVGMAEPILKVEYPPEEFRFYGKRRADAARMIFFEFVPGFRLFSMGQQLSVNDAHVEYIAGTSGRPFSQVLEDTVVSPMSFLGLVHGLGVLLKTEGHIANFTLDEDGVVRFAPDFGLAARGESEVDRHDEKVRLIGELDDWILQKNCFLGRLGDKGVRKLRERALEGYERGLARGSSQF